MLEHASCFVKNRDSIGESMSIPKLTGSTLPLSANLHQEKKVGPETAKVSAAAAAALSGNQPFVQPSKSSAHAKQTSEDCDEINGFSDDGYSFGVSDSDSENDYNKEELFVSEKKTILLLDEAEHAEPLSYLERMGSRTGGY